VIEPGKYEGSGTGEDGTTYKLKATYRENKSDGKPKSELEYEAQDSKGNSSKGYIARLQASSG
jgi:hypothetical protein